MELDQGELLKEISSFLENNNIPYMITGALSVVYYGRPRASHDIDFVVEIHKAEIQKVLKALKRLSLDYQVQQEAVEDAIEKKGMFNIIYLPYYLKLDFWLLTNDEFDQSRFSRRQKVKLLDQFMTITSAEDTIIQKLRWYKEAQIEKHIVDAAFVYQTQVESLDQKYIDNWINKLQLTGFFEEMKKIDLDHYV